jgi:hypothetical protein
VLPQDLVGADVIGQARFVDYGANLSGLGRWQRHGGGACENKNEHRQGQTGLPVLALGARGSSAVHAHRKNYTLNSPIGRQKNSPEKPPELAGRLRGWSHGGQYGDELWAASILFWAAGNFDLSRGHTRHAPVEYLPCPCHPGTARLAAHAARAASVAAWRAQRGRDTHATVLCPLRGPGGSPPRAVAPPRGPRCPCTLASRCAPRRPGADRQRLIHGLGEPPGGGGRCDASVAKMRCGPNGGHHGPSCCGLG